MTRSANRPDDRREPQDPAAQRTVRRTVNRLIGAAVVLCVAAPLGSCAGGASESGFSAYVADHWPRWAGGMPDDVPPRPGAPGYNAFIAHGQAGADAATGTAAPSGTTGATAAAAKPIFQTAPCAAPAAAVAPQAASDDPSVVQGGLY